MSKQEIESERKQRAAVTAAAIALTEALRASVTSPSNWPDAITREETKDAHYDALLKAARAWIPFKLEDYRHEGATMLFAAKGGDLFVGRITWDAETPAELDSDSGYVVDDITHYMQISPP